MQYPPNSQRPYEPSTSNNEKDVTGALWQNFDATRFVSQPFLDQIRKVSVFGRSSNETFNPTNWEVTIGVVRSVVSQSPLPLLALIEKPLPLGITLGMMIMAGAIMLYASYTFFIAGISFVGRLIELWVLIIFSPFAFMSSSIPKLEKAEYFGWEAWFKRLISTAFMAPIFMFFMYLIFRLLGAKMFEGAFQGQGIMVQILAIVFPALIILGMLRGATKFAKKGGGEFAEMAIKGAKVVGGLAVAGGMAAATGGAGLLLQGTLGQISRRVADSKTVNEGAAKGKFGYGALKLR